MRALLFVLGGVVAAMALAIGLYLAGIIHGTKVVSGDGDLQVLVDQQGKQIARLKEDLIQSRKQAEVERKIVDALRNATNSAQTPEGRQQMVAESAAAAKTAATPGVDTFFAGQPSEAEWGSCKQSDGSEDFSTVATGIGKCYSPGIKAKLQKAAQETTDAYRDCLDKLSHAGEDTDDEPGDWRNLSDDENSDASSAKLLKLAEDKGGPIYDSCKNAVEKAKETKSAEKAVSTALTLAANVCFASGGNPYVCAGMLVVAILMEEFGSGDGNGDGSGQGNEDGNGPGAGAGNGPGAGAGNGPGTGDGEESQEPPNAGPSPNPLDGGVGAGAFSPPAPPSRPTTLTVRGKGGDVTCTATGSTSRSVWSCATAGGNPVTINLSSAPAGASLAFLQKEYLNKNSTMKGEKPGVLFCNKLEGIAFADEDKFTAIKLPAGPQTRPTIQAPNLETACSMLNSN